MCVRVCLHGGKIRDMCVCVCVFLLLLGDSVRAPKGGLWKSVCDRGFGEEGGLLQPSVVGEPDMKNALTCWFDDMATKHHGTRPS